MKDLVLYEYNSIIRNAFCSVISHLFCVLISNHCCSFFPYWTGFFTSQAQLKRLVRSSSAFLHAAWAMQSFAALTQTKDVSDKKAAALNVLWGAVAVTQSHDGVDGTSPTKTVQDFMTRLKYGIEVASKQLASLLPAGFVACPPGRLPLMCDNTRAGLMPGKKLAVSVTNALAWTADEWISLEVPPGTFVVSDGVGSTVASQTSPRVNGNSTLLWRATALPPMGTVLYTVTRATPTTAGSSVAATVLPLPADGIELSFDAGLTVRVDRQGRLAEVVRNGTHRYPMNVDVLYYKGLPYHARRLQTSDSSSSGVHSLEPGGTSDDSYDFNPDGNASSAWGLMHFGGALPTPVSAQYIKGPLHSEVRALLDAKSGIVLSTGLYQGDDHVNLNVGMGDVPGFA